MKQSSAQPITYINYQRLFYHIFAPNEFIVQIKLHFVETNHTFLQLKIVLQGKKVPTDINSNSRKKTEEARK